MIDFIDLFAGIGGFHLGLTGSRVQESQQDIHRNCTDITSSNGNGGSEHSFNCVWASEWDKYAATTYRKNFPEVPLSTDDIRKVPADAIPNHDLLCAGFPCQAFSVAGKRRGLEEARGTLFYEIARIAERKRPRLLLLENVKGLLSHDGGRTFALILRVLGGVGYRCEWQVLNSKWFGVPQNRERVFIIGHLGEEPSATVFPITEISGGDNEAGERPVVGALTGGGHSGGLHSQMTLIANTLMEHDRSALASDNLVVLPMFNPSRPTHWQEGKPYREAGGDSYSLTAQDRHGVAVMETANCLDVDGYLRTGARPRDENGKPQLLPIGYRRIRRLTPLECERLQGFPDGWTEGVSDTQRYKQLGNAVTVPVIRFLGERISILSTQKFVGTEEK